MLVVSEGRDGEWELGGGVSGEYLNYDYGTGIFLYLVVGRNISPRSRRWCVVNTQSYGRLYS